MSLTAAMIDAMVQAGCTAEQLAAVMKADLAERESRESDRLAKQAERTRRSRARNAVSRDVTLQGVTECDIVTPPPLSRPPNENNSNPPTHTPPDITTRARKGHRLPADWEPAPLTGDVSEAVAAWPDGAIARELARFRDWAKSATGQNALKSDWQAAWRNWLRRKVDEGTNQNGGNTRHTAQTGGGLTAPNGRPMGRTESAARAAAGMAGPGKSGRDHASPSALPDHRRAIGYVP